MGCRLHNIIGQFENREFLVNADLSIEEENAIVHFFKKHSKNAICFDVGDIDDFPNGNPGFFDKKFPYPVTWIETNFKFEGNFNSVGLLCFEDYLDNGKVANIIIVLVRNEKTEGKWFLDGSMIRFKIDDENKIAYWPNSKEKINKFNSLLDFIKLFLTVLNCKNVEATENSPPDRLQKKRLKKGKLPIFSYWTLHLKLPKTKSSNLKNGGAHASPRLHLRRGHPREYKPGMFTWVAECVVGNKEKGLIMKDYDVKVSE